MSFAPFLAPERDDRAALGRPERSVEIYYVVPGWGWTGNSTFPFVNGADFYQAWYTPTPIIIDQLVAEVTTASASTNFRMGFYRADRDWQPIGAPLADSGSISAATTGVKTFTPGTAIYVPRGRYLSVHNTDSAVPVFRSWRGVSMNQGIDSALASNLLTLMQVTRAYAAFPTPGTAWDTEQLGSTPAVNIVLYRVSTP